MVTKKRRVPLQKNVFFITGIITLLLILLGFGGEYLVRVHDDITRKNRIEAIYSSLNLGPDYAVTFTSIFGDKRLYTYDQGRSYASSVIYQHNATVSETVTDMRQRIEAIGFVYFEEPYPGSTFRELHFKSSKDEYIRLNVSSKSRDDLLRNAFKDGKTPSNSIYNTDSNAAPSTVTLKVNLDNNNE